MCNTSRAKECVIHMTVLQGETAEEMNSWIEAINGISHRGRSCSEPVRILFCFASCLKSMGGNCLLLLLIFSFASNLKTVLDLW